MPKERKRARNRNIGVVLLLALVFLLSVFAGVLLLRELRASEQSPVGRWRMELDLTDHARTCANLWLREAALGDRVDAGDALPRLSVGILLTLDADGRWSRSVDRASYDAAAAAAVRAAGASLQELLALRLADSGRSTAGGAEALFRSATGMSPAEYLSRHGPQLLTPLAELEGRFNGGGSYTASDGRLSLDGRQFSFALADGMLILSDAGGSEVYRHA